MYWREPILSELVVCRNVGAACALLGAIDCDFDEDLTDFFCIAPNAGVAINAAVAKQLTRTNPLVFIIYYSSLSFINLPKRWLRMCLGLSRCEMLSRP